MAGSKRQDNNRADPSGPVDSDSDGSAVPKCGRVADQHKRFPARAVRGRVKELGDPAREGRSGEPAADHVGASEKRGLRLRRRSRPSCRQCGRPSPTQTLKLINPECDYLGQPMRLVFFGAIRGIDPEELGLPASLRTGGASEEYRRLLGREPGIMPTSS